MTSRRTFLLQAAAASVAAAANPSLGRAAMPSIKAIIRRDDTVLRHGGHGDAWHMSWGADYRQYVSMVEGAGFSGQSRQLNHSRMLTITGDPYGARFDDLPGYPRHAAPPRNFNNDTRYLGYGTLALDGRIYQFMSTYDRPLRLSESDIDNLFRFVGTKLIFSPDGGRSWRNQNDSEPVIWEPYGQRSKENMLFWEEDQDTFCMISVLQMGRNYEHNRDGYIYLYSPNGMTEGSMNELVMLRVPKARILHRESYEYFAGRRADGSAKWVRDIQARQVVHTFPSGWVNKLLHPYAWQPSVVYNAPLGLYMLANWATGLAADGTWFSKPSYLGFWVAANPWGPWEQVHEETAWTPEGDADARCFQSQISPKWIAADGKSFWLVFSDVQKTNAEAMKRLAETGNNLSDGTDNAAFVGRQLASMRKFEPYFSFNVQRFDIVV